MLLGDMEYKQLGSLGGNSIDYFDLKNGLNIGPKTSLMCHLKRIHALIYYFGHFMPLFGPIFNSSSIPNSIIDGGHRQGVPKMAPNLAQKSDRKSALVD